MTGLSDVAAAAPKVDGPRFLVVSQLPTYAAVLYLALLVAAGAPGGSLDFGDAFRRLDRVSVTAALVGGLAVVLLALVVHPLQLSLVRAMEGYWPGRWGRALGRLAARRQERRRGRAVKAATVEGTASPAAEADALRAGWELARRFPPAPVELLPTALGNALRAMEATAGSAYGAEAASWWPRLYCVLGAQVREVVDDRRTQLDVACRLSATAAIAAAATPTLLFRSGWWLLLAAIPLGIAWVAYRAAVAAATAYGDSVRTAFDLHRFDLLGALHLPLPANPSAEQAINRRLSRFWDQDVPLDGVVYHHDAPDAPA